MEGTNQNVSNGFGKALDNKGVKHGFRYAWTITKDIIGEDLLGLRGPGGCDVDAGYITQHGHAFRIKDDDGEVYYLGRICGDDIEGFEPLDDYGAPGLGATAIEYWDNGWKTL